MSQPQSLLSLGKKQFKDSQEKAIVVNSWCWCDILDLCSFFLWKVLGNDVDNNCFSYSLSGVSDSQCAAQQCG